MTIKDHIEATTSSNQLGSNDSMSVYAATYPDKQTSPVFWALAAMDLMVLTRDGPDPLHRYLDVSTLCSDTGLAAVTYHDGLLDDACLFQLAHKPSFLASLRSKPGMPRKFRTAIKLLSRIPTKGSVVLWAGPRRSLSAGSTPQTSTRSSSQPQPI